MEIVWWFWMVIAIVFAAIELLTPGSIFWIFFTIGSVFAGAYAWLSPSSGPVLQGVIFVSVSLIALAFFRKPLRDWLDRNIPNAPIDTLVGELATVLEEIPAGAVGKAELRGTPWSATNAGPAALHPSQRCRVERVDGLMLWIRSES